MEGRTDRQQFRKAAGVATMGPAGASGRGGFDADVVVVGAGFAGMTAAYRLVEGGHSVIVMEAMGRVGGRSLSTQLSDGTMVDLGAGWTGSTQTYMLRLIQELGLETYTQYGVGEDPSKEPANLYVAADGHVTPFQGQAFPVKEYEQIKNAIGTIDSLMQTVPFETPWTAPNAVEWDATSAGAFARQLVSDPEALAIVLANLTTIFGLNPFAVSLLHALWDSRMAGGIQQFGAVTVVSDRATVRARRVVVAIPGCLTGFIRFDPILPADRAQLLQRVPQGSAIKAQLVYDRAFWRPGLSGYSFAIDDSAVTQTVDAGGPVGEDTPGILSCFIEDDAARNLGRMTQPERRDLILRELARRFDPAEVTNLSRTITPNYVENISQDLEWIRGDYASTPGPRVLTASGFGPALRMPFRWIHWAGVDTANGEWYQTLDGAVQSGERVALEVINSGL